MPPEDQHSSESPNSPSRTIEEREEFLATVAHDLKNPLSAIFGYADTLLTALPPDALSPKAREMVAKMRSISARSIDLVRNYQQLAEISRPVASHSRTDINTVIRTVVDEAFREREEDHTIRLLLDSGALYVMGERISLERVISNLYGNALRYTPKGGTITLASSTERSSAPAPSACGPQIELPTEWAIVSVHNTGSALAPHEHLKIFERRYRGSTSQGTSGTGLGLFIVRETVKRLGGSIDVQSSPQDGTTFTIRLPLAKNP
jgi:signal transduction histidine kinase